MVGFKNYYSLEFLWGFNQLGHSSSQRAGCIFTAQDMLPIKIAQSILPGLLTLIPTFPDYRLVAIESHAYFYPEFLGTNFISNSQSNASAIRSIVFNVKASLERCSILDSTGCGIPQRIASCP
jgi:hypothetical protein